MTTGVIAGIPVASNERIAALFSHYSWILKAVLYGSRAKGSFKPGSDIDLTLINDAPVSLKDLNKVELDLDDLDLPWNIDLSIYGDIENASLRDHIDRVGITIYERRGS